MLTKYKSISESKMICIIALFSKYLRQDLCIGREKTGKGLQYQAVGSPTSISGSQCYRDIAHKNNKIRTNLVIKSIVNLEVQIIVRISGRENGMPCFKAF